jgi:hypothetical protein
VVALGYAGDAARYPDYELLDAEHHDDAQDRVRYL